MVRKPPDDVRHAPPRRLLASIATGESPRQHGTIRSSMQSFEHTGFWWDPRAPEIKWPGTLHFDPVTGAILKRLIVPDVSSIVADHKEFDVLLGETTTGKEITL